MPPKRKSVSKQVIAYKQVFIKSSKLIIASKLSCCSFVKMMFLFYTYICLLLSAIYQVSVIRMLGRSLSKRNCFMDSNYMFALQYT